MQVVRESIFFSGVRSFCNAFFSFLGIIIGLLLLVFLFFAVMRNRLDQAPRTEIAIWPDAEGNRKLLPPTAPVILCIDIKGVIGQGYLRANVIEEILLDSREDIFEGSRVRGILLNINTPGGFATEADDIYRILLNYKNKYGIPIYAYVEGLCASGGMFVASATDKIYSSPSSIIGSVGVLLGPNFNFSGLMERYGVTQKTFTEGKDKDMLNPFRPWKPGEDDCLIAINVATYERFVDAVVKARPRLSKEKLVHEYGAQVYIAETAEKLGYIDEGNSSYSEALTALANAAQIPENETYQVIKISPIRNIINELIQSKFPFKVQHRLELGGLEKEGKPLLLYSS